MEPNNKAKFNGANVNALSQNELMRLFIAVDVGDEVRSNLTAEQVLINKLYPGVKWVAPEAIHLTLAFLGDVWGNNVDAIAQVLEQVGKTRMGFGMTIQGLGTFGSTKSPHVIWAGINEGGEAITTLQRRIAESFISLNMTLESRPFHPHVTIGRIKTSHDATKLNLKLEECKSTVYGKIKVDHFNLMRSLIHSQGVTYSVLREFALQP